MISNCTIDRVISPPPPLPCSESDIVTLLFNRTTLLRFILEDSERFCRKEKKKYKKFSLHVFPMNFMRLNRTFASILQLPLPRLSFPITIQRKPKIIIDVTSCETTKLHRTMQTDQKNVKRLWIIYVFTTLEKAKGKKNVVWFSPPFANRHLSLPRRVPKHWLPEKCPETQTQTELTSGAVIELLPTALPHLPSFIPVSPYVFFTVSS